MTREYAPGEWRPALQPWHRRAAMLSISMLGSAWWEAHHPRRVSAPILAHGALSMASAAAQLARAVQRRRPRLAVAKLVELGGTVAELWAARAEPIPHPTRASHG